MYNKIDISRSAKMKAKFSQKIDKAHSLKVLNQLMHQMEYAMSLSNEDYDYLYKKILDKRNRLQGG
jgi:hypothetical protein